jgi:hypothetical protein
VLTAKGPWFATIGTVVLTSLMLAGSLGVSAVAQSRIDDARAELAHAIAEGGSCIGSSAFGPESDCPDPFAVTALTDHVARLGLCIDDEPKSEIRPGKERRLFCLEPGPVLLLALNPSLNSVAHDGRQEDASNDSHHNQCNRTHDRLLWRLWRRIQTIAPSPRPEKRAGDNPCGLRPLFG